jgi:hypothetical protein
LNYQPKIKELAGRVFYFNGHTGSDSLDFLTADNSNSSTFYSRASNKGLSIYYYKIKILCYLKGIALAAAD